MDTNETVTLSIERYNQMMDEIRSLKKQVEQKTIVKQVLHPIYGVIALVFIIMIQVFLIIKH